MFFKRLSRSRSNSQSYVDNYSPQDSKAPSANYDDVKYNDNDGVRPSSSRRSNNASGLDDPLQKETGMYPRQSQPQEVSHGYGSPPVSAGGLRGPTNGYGSHGLDTNASPAIAKSSEPAPDLLLQAFNQALRPYTDKVEGLEAEIQDLRNWVDQLELQRNEVHAWIDKRGLRPGKFHIPQSNCRATS